MLVIRLVCLSSYLLLVMGLLSALVLPFWQIVWASENTTALSSPYVHRLWGNDKELPATLTAWKEVDLAYERLFPYDQSRQPHPPAGCVVLPAILHNSYKQSTGITTSPTVLMLRCRERIELLRPARWVRSRLRAQNRQGYLLVSMPEMGIMGVQVHVVAVRSSAFNPATVAMRSASSRPVIGLFIRHTTNVRQYTFKDTLTGKLERIKATPNHPFYVFNQQRYIPVSHLSPHDQLINVLGHSITLICPPGKSSHCGRPYHPGQVIPVYNLEVYGQHRYFVGEPGIMVHNVYKCEMCGAEFKKIAPFELHISTRHPGYKPFRCDMCIRAYTRHSALMLHLKTHLGKEESPFRCESCNIAFPTARRLKIHEGTMKHLKNVRMLAGTQEALAEAQTTLAEEASSMASGSFAGITPVRERSRSPLGSDITFEDFLPPIVTQPASVDSQPVFPFIDSQLSPQIESGDLSELPELDPKNF